MRRAYELLKLLRARFPPPPGKHHQLVVADDRDDHQLVLRVVVHFEDRYASADFEPGDLDKPAEVLVDELVALVRGAPQASELLPAAELH